MTRSLVCASGAAALLLISTAAQAADKPGSVFLQCDGKPANITAAETTARILVIMATAGLAGSSENADVSKRLEGANGVAACDAALATEHDETRRVQLTLAHAIHEIEAKNFQTALNDARSIPTVAGARAQEHGFQRSLMLSGMELEAAALVRLGRPGEAEQVALAMGAKAPWDLLNMNRAALYVGLTPEMTPAKRDFYAQYVRLTPQALNIRSRSRQWGGDFAGAAADIESLVETQAGFTAAGQPPPDPIFAATPAASWALAGNMEKSNALAADARARLDERERTGKAAASESTVSATEELLDFQAVARLLAEGKATEARSAFAARSRWIAPSPPAVALLTQRLRAGAAPEELTGALARDPAILRADGLSAKSGYITENPDGAKNLYGGIRFVVNDADFAALSRNVWKTDKSRYLLKPTGKEKYVGEAVYMQGVIGVPAGEALLLHCALLARSRGKTGFVLIPVRSRLDSAVVRFGVPGEQGFPVDAAFDAATVIAALSVEMPEPAKAP